MLPDELTRLIDTYEDNLKDCPWRRNWKTDQTYRECISVEDRTCVGQKIEEILRRSSASASTEALERLVAVRDVVVDDRIENRRNIYDDYEEHLVKGGFYSAGEIRRLADCELKRRGLVLHEGKAWTPEDLQKHLTRKQELRDKEKADQQKADKSHREFEIWTFVGIAVLFVLFTLIILNS